MKAQIRGNAVFFICPGCAQIEAAVHLDMMNGLKRIPFQGDEPGPKWSFNGSEDRPTLTPSLLTRFRYEDRDNVCHSFVTDGRIQFLGDCTHSLANQTVELPDFPEGIFE